MTRLPFSMFHMAWISYLSAPLAVGLTPPAELAAQRMPGGGLILSAVQDRLDPDNSDHVRRSRILTDLMLERVGNDGTSPRWGPRIVPY
jgi:hypothetical protein